MLGHYHIDTVGHEVTSPHAAAASSEEQAFDEISIRDIAERAQIGYATFFRNYESLRAVLHDLIADQIRQVIRLTFSNSLRDTVTLAELTRIDICIDAFSCCADAGLKQTIERAAPRTSPVPIGEGKGTNGDAPT